MHQWCLNRALPGNKNLKSFAIKRRKIPLLARRGAETNERSEFVEPAWRQTGRGGGIYFVFPTSPHSPAFGSLGAPPIPDARFARSGQEGLIQVFVGTVESEKRLETKLAKRHEAHGWKAGLENLVEGWEINDLNLILSTNFSCQRQASSTPEFCSQLLYYW